jgi:hypothetical protein
MKTPIKYQWNWNHTIFQVLPLCLGPSPNSWHLCALGLGSTLFRLSARLKTSLHWTLTYHRQQSHSCSLEYLHPPCPRFNAYKAHEINPLQITYLIHSNLRHPCLHFHMSLQLPSTPSYPKQASMSHWQLSHLYYTLSIEPIPVIIHWLATKFFAHCLAYPNPLVQQIGNYTVADLTSLYLKYKHKWPKHILL